MADRKSLDVPAVIPEEWRDRWKREWRQQFGDENTEPEPSLAYEWRAQMAQDGYAKQFLIVDRSTGKFAGTLTTRRAMTVIQARAMALE